MDTDPKQGCQISSPGLHLDQVVTSLGFSFITCEIIVLINLLVGFNNTHFVKNNLTAPSRSPSCFWNFSGLRRPNDCTLLSFFPHRKIKIWQLFTENNCNIDYKTVIAVTFCWVPTADFCFMCILSFPPHRSSRRKVRLISQKKKLKLVWGPICGNLRFKPMFVWFWSLFFLKACSAILPPFYIF